MGPMVPLTSSVTIVAGKIIETAHQQFLIRLLSPVVLEGRLEGPYLDMLGNEHGDYHM